MNLHPSHLVPCENCGAVYANVLYAVAHEAKCRPLLKADEVVLLPL